MSRPGTFQKGNKGRPKGAVNKSTASVKAAMTEAFDKMGGVEALLAWAKTEPTEFYKLWAKMLPQDVEGTFTGTVTVKMEWAESWAMGDGEVVAPSRN